MKRFIAALSATALLLASAPAFADGNRQKHRGHGYAKHQSYKHSSHNRHRYEKRGHGGHGYKQRGHSGHGYKGHGSRHRSSKHRDHGSIIVGALVGGAVLGHLLSQPSYAAPSYQAPPPRPLLGNCHATTGSGYYNGRPAQFGGTMCYDQYGRGYVNPGSRYFMGYLR